MLDEVCEGVVQVAGGLLEHAEGDFDIGGAKFFNALAADQGVGIAGRDDAAGDAGGYEGVGAGASAAVVAAGLEGDVGGGSFGGDASLGGLFEGYDLGVVAIVVEVSAFADDPGRAASEGCLGQDAAYLGVRRGEADGLPGELEGSLHEAFVLRVGCVFDHFCLKDSGFIDGMIQRDTSALAGYAGANVALFKSSRARFFRAEDTSNFWPAAAK